MKNLFVPYEQALELKELGFNETCFASIDNFSKTPYIPSKGGTYFNSKDYLKETVACPLYQQAFRFFREKYGLYVISKPHIGKTKKYICDPVNIRLEAKNTYEEAENACLLELINICKKK